MLYTSLCSSARLYYQKKDSGRNRPATEPFMPKGHNVKLSLTSGWHYICTSYCTHDSILPSKTFPHIKVMGIAAPKDYTK